MCLRIVEQLFPRLPLRRKSNERRVWGHESGASVDVKVMRGESGGIDDACRGAYEDIGTR